MNNLSQYILAVQLSKRLKKCLSKRFIVMFGFTLLSAWSTSINAQAMHEDAFLLHRKNPCLITKNSIDKLKIGMSYAQIKKSYPSALIEQESDGDGVNFTVVYLNKVDKQHYKPLLSIYFDNIEPQGKKGRKPTAKITMLATQHMACKTNEGIAPGDLLTKGIAVYGGLKHILATPIEARQYAYFIKASKYLGFQVSYGAAILPNGETTGRTKGFQKDAKIISIFVSRDKNDE